MTLDDPTDDRLPEARPATPEQRMLGALLATTVGDLVGSDEDLRLEAVRWLYGEPLPGPGWSFEDLCEHLSLEPEHVRRSAIRWALAGRKRWRRAA